MVVRAAVSQKRFTGPTPVEFAPDAPVAAASWSKLAANHGLVTIEEISVGSYDPRAAFRGSLQR